MFSRSTRNELRKYSDGELVAEYQLSGDMDCLGELYQRNVELILLVCCRYLGDREASRDASMEIFEKIATALRKSSVHNFQAWLHTIVRNHCLIKLRHRKHIVLPLDYENGVPELSDTGSEPFDEFDNVERDWEALLPEVLAQIKEEQRQCIELFYFEKKRYKEIAELLGISLKQVKFNLQNGRNRLRTLLFSRAQQSNEGEKLHTRA